MDRQYIGRYRIGDEIARGGLSTVYAGVDPATEQPVAVKVSRTLDPSERQWAVERFRREAALVSKLRHPGIVAFYDQGTLPDGSPYLVTEQASGRTLEEILRDDGKIALPIALSIAEQAASAMGAAHNQGFVHADIKPGNIILLEQSAGSPPAVKLLDFGVAGLLETSTGETRAGVLVGTPVYMSPEQIKAGALSPASDIWSLGMVLFEMLTGTLPFTGESTVAVMSGIMTAQVQIPSDASIPPPVAAFLLRCLNKDPRMRPADGSEAEKEIRCLREQFAAAPKEECREEPPPPPSRQTPAETPHRDIAAAPRRRIGWIAVVAAILAMAGVAVVLVLFTRGPWLGLALGLGLVLGGVLLGQAAKTWLETRRDAFSSRVRDVLSGARSREHLSRSLAIQVDELVDRCRLVDEKILATTMAVMIEEYSAAKDFDDRQKALMNAVALLEKLMPRLSPWYVRHDKLIGFGVTVVGILSGLTTMIQNVIKLIKGT